jgi:hypothetical protein
LFRAANNVALKDIFGILGVIRPNLTSFRRQQVGLAFFKQLLCLSRSGIFRNPAVCSFGRPLAAFCAPAAGFFVFLDGFGSAIAPAVLRIFACFLVVFAAFRGETPSPSSSSRS